MNNLYKSLNPAERSFVDEKTISATYKIKRWLVLLAKASKMDEMLEAEVKKWNLYGTIFIVLFIIALISTFVLEDMMYVTIAIPLAIVFLVVGIIIFRKSNQLKARDISDYMRKFFLPVLGILKETAGEDAKLAAALDFRIPRKALQAKKSKVGIRSIKSYHPNYIRSKVQLKDGAILEFSVADQIQDLSWKKRNPRGKVKYKKKTKYLHQCLIKITLPKSEYEKKAYSIDSVTITDHNDSYIAKHKIKLKDTGLSGREDEISRIMRTEGPKKVKEYVDSISKGILEVAIFFKGIQTIYNQFNALNNPQKRKNDEDGDDDGHEIEVYDNGVDAMDVAVAYIWMDTDFDNYDYDSFDYAEGSDFSMDDDAATVFDS